MVKYQIQVHFENKGQLDYVFEAENNLKKLSNALKSGEIVFVKDVIGRDLFYQTKNVTVIIATELIEEEKDAPQERKIEEDHQLEHQRNDRQWSPPFPGRCC